MRIALAVCLQDTSLCMSCPGHKGLVFMTASKFIKFAICASRASLFSSSSGVHSRFLQVRKRTKFRTCALLLRFLLPECTHGFYKCENVSSLGPVLCFFFFSWSALTIFYQCENLSSLGPVLFFFAFFSLDCTHGFMSVKT